MMICREQADVIIHYKKIHQDARVPRRKTEGAACFDIYSPIDMEIESGKTKLIPTGLVLAIQKGYEGVLRPRSGLSIKKGQILPNSPATIDSDYRGELKAGLTNTTDNVYHVRKGDRVCQLCIRKVPDVYFIEDPNLGNDTKRGIGGFGSTGR